MPGTSWGVRRHILTLATGLLVAATACLLPLLSQRQSQSEAQKKLAYAFQLRNPPSHRNLLHSLPSEPTRLQLAHDAYLDQDYALALSQLRLYTEADGTTKTNDELSNLRADLEQCLLYNLPWPEKVTAWLSVELDGERDHVLVRLIDPGTGNPPRSLRLELLGWRNQRYRPLEAESYNLEGLPHHQENPRIRNLLALSSVNVYRPKEGSKGQVFVTYLTDHQEYVAEIYLLKDGHLRRFRWVSQRPIKVHQERLAIYNSDLAKTEEWVLRGEKWHNDKPR